MLLLAHCNETLGPGEQIGGIGVDGSEIIAAETPVDRLVVYKSHYLHLHLHLHF